MFDVPLRKALERLYEVFAGYPAPSKLEGSSAEDVAGMERDLKSAPLRLLSDDQLGPYAGSALLTVGVGDVPAYKHFLPRIIEIGAQGSGHVGPDAPIVAERLKLARWRTWPAVEQAAIKQAFTAVWSWSVDQHPGSGRSAEEWLCGIAALEEPVAPVLDAWSARHSMEALLQSAWLAATRLTSPTDRDLAYWSFVAPSVRNRITAWATGDERVAAFLKGREGVDEYDRQYVDQALEASGFRQPH